ncbi:MAG: heme-binding domain-containing protein [Flavobacteriales bacterium]
MLKRILIILLAAFLVAQFFRPDRDVPAIDPAQDMLAMTGAPQEIRSLVIGACYDCHSHATDYPWYAHITPVNFIMQHHINEGREHLNFSRWDKFAGSKHAGECGEVIQEGEMPPMYYRLMHRHGRLSDAQKQQLLTWFAANLKGGEGGKGAAPEGGEEEDED